MRTSTNFRIGSFPLEDKKWRMFFVPWGEFTPDISDKGFYFLNLKVAPEKLRQAWAVVARPSLCKDEQT